VLEVIGEIVALQIHIDRVKTPGVGYEPTPIMKVDQAAIGPAGIVGLRDDAWIVDVHHSSHPRSGGGGRRVLSMGFTGHYAAMTDRFGDAPVGVAGENIVIDGPALRQGDLGGGVVIHTSSGPLRLLDPRVMTPCREFTSYLLGSDRLLDREDLTGHLEFLDGGTRGFVLDPGHLERPVEVAVGDRVELLDD